MRLLLYTSLLLSLSTLCVAQEDTTRLFVEAGGVAATSQRTPFWLRANQFGTVPLENPFVFVKAGGQTLISKNLRKAQLHLQTEIVANAGRTSLVVLPVAAATFRYRRFEAYVGRRKEFFGLGDTLLTSGSYAWSGNALPLPKIQAGTRGFVPLGFTKGLFAFQATFSHGWFGNQDSVQGSYLHQKTVFVRLGKPQWKAKFYLGMIHNVQWGGKSAFVDPRYLVNGRFPSSFKDLLYLTVAKTPRAGGFYSSVDTLNQIGNHLGSIDFGTQLQLKNQTIFVYHQHPFEDKSGLVFVNFPDGLYGIRIKNNHHQLGFKLDQLTFEYLTTLDRGANLREDLKNRYEADVYFYHGQYGEGWTYNKKIIGTPFITSKFDTRAEIKSWSIISSNRLQAFYMSFSGRFSEKIFFDSKWAYSQNFNLTFNNKPSQAGQFSGLIKLTSAFLRTPSTFLQVIFALDRGLLYEPSFGGQISLKRVW